MGDSHKQEDDLPTGVSYEEISHPLLQKIMTYEPRLSDGFVRLIPYNQVFPKRIIHYMSKIKEFPVRNDDIWVASSPKSGTTWTQEMVWCIMNKSFDGSQTTRLRRRVPFFEFSAIFPTEQSTFDQVMEAEPPRIIKTHLSFDMLPSQCMKEHVRIVYVTRNPRDVCVSLFNHLKVINNYSGSFVDLAELFLNDICIYYSPILQGVLSYWNERSRPNILIITYEEMKSDLSSVIRKVTEFLGQTMSNEEVSQLCDHLSFQNMKANPMVNNTDVIQLVREKQIALKVDGPNNPEFIWKGKVGNWKEYFTPELLKRFKKWEAEHLKNSDLKFVYE